ncbi:hypothetical protein ES288_D05G314300v1 [Gossypium darwinii]|uniref:RNase H type-1 domain-containing protein n=1 Tax=Gossypium darwinii TaxID=34276 RepID=A0A5D2CQW5_GOSDA|nr:hypothetical protein ES288_D05G314300v1 [Gossypium darwinii]
MRALMWAKVVHNNCTFSESDWWSWLGKCCVGGRSMRTRDLVRDPSPLGRIKFNLAGVKGVTVVMNEIAACRGVLRDDKRLVSTLFSGRCVAGGLEMAVLVAIKEAAEMVIELIQKDRLRPWSFRNLLANIEESLRQMPEVQIVVTNRGKNGMVKALAKVGLSRNTLFGAYW